MNSVLPKDVEVPKKAEESAKAEANVKKNKTKTKKKKKKKKKKRSEVEVAKKELEEKEEEGGAIIFEEGQHVDVKALLCSKSRDFLVTTKGNDSVPIDSLEGKYVLVCCMMLPFDLASQQTQICRCLEVLFSELSLQPRLADTLKIVLVGNIAPGALVPNFDDFFSKLSLNCLAIPYSDSESRDRVCKLVYLHDYFVPCLMVDPTGLFLEFFDTFSLINYGAQCYPFARDHFDNIRLDDDILRRRILSKDDDPPISLVQLLQCDYLSQIGTNVSIPTSDLDCDGDTVVGIYLCYRFDFMSELQTIHQTCRDKGLKFEIVLLPVPLGTYSDPHSFYNQIKQSASKNPTSSSWWTMPFNDNICRSLWRLLYSGPKDHLIILPRSGHPGELQGKHFASSYGVDAFPFTRDTILQRRLYELQSVTLKELVGVDFYDLHHLHNKNVLLCLDYPSFKYHDNGRSLYKIVDEVYSEIKVIYRDTKVVFVPMTPLNSVEEGRIKKTWPILPQESCEHVIKHIYNPYQYEEAVMVSLVAFGKDGRILSRTAAERLPGNTNSDDGSLFDDTLASEIVRDIEDDMLYSIY